MNFHASKQHESLSFPRRSYLVSEQVSVADEVVEVPEELVWESRTLFALLAKTDLLLL